MLQSSAQMISCEAFMMQFPIVSYADIVIWDLYSFLNAGPSVEAKWKQYSCQKCLNFFII